MLAFEILYISIIAAICLYGVHRFWLVLGSLRRLPATPLPGKLSFGDAPRVLVQLPIYNESAVIERLIDSACELDWPNEQLEIQVLDDSTDDTPDIVAASVEAWREKGVAIEHVRRGGREGFKAGALAYGLDLCDAPFVAIFDADFVIPAEYLKRTVPLFHDDEKLALVQARWGFMNTRHNLLTRVQALLLDGHFHVEHRARAASGRFFNFNGTAGIWRRAAIDDAGGWQSITITEDLDLSLRAWLAGWNFRYLDDVEVPSSLPEAMPAFKIQQNRWVSGSIQTAKVLLPKILASHLKLSQKIDLCFYLTGNLTYFFLMLLALCIPQAVLIRFDSMSGHVLLWADIPFFIFATASVVAFYWQAHRPEWRPVRLLLWRIPCLMAVGLGMTVHNTRAVMRGLFSASRVFEHTPKGGAKVEAQQGRRRKRRDFLYLLEPVMAVYVLIFLGIGLTGESFVSVPFLGLFVWGYLLVFWETVRRR